MKRIGLLLLLLTACEGEDMRSPTFFEKYGATELGTTKIITASQVYGVRGQNQKMIDVSVEDAAACPVIVSIRTEYVNEPTMAIGGPIVATAQWGIGGGENQVEFDVPSSRLPQLLAPYGVIDGNTRPMTNIGNGVQVYLGGASHVSVYVRNDGSLASLTNVINQNALGLAPNDHIGSESPIKIIVHIEPASSSGGPKIERTIWTAGGVAGVLSSQLVPATGVLVSVPPFAKSVRVQRTPSGGPIQLTFATNIGSVYRTIDLGPNDEGPVEFDSATNGIGFINTGAANITQLQAVFDVTPA